MSNTQYDNPILGCYFDSTYGQTCNDLRVIDLALCYGWNDDEARKFDDTSEDDLTEDQLETLTYVVQDAEDYLNSLEARPFVSWQWYDGDFGLYADVDEARELLQMDGFVSSKSQEYPDDDYAGEWLHVNDHGNATLYVRENGEDTEIWSAV